MCRRRTEPRNAASFILKLRITDPAPGQRNWGGRNKFWGGHEKFIYVNSRGARGHESGSNEQGKEQKKKVFTETQRDFPAENRHSNSFSLPKTDELQKNGLHPENFMKSWQTPIWASFCTPVAPILLISWGHSPRLGEHNFRLKGHEQSFGGARPRNAPPWRRAWRIILAVQDLKISFYMQILVPPHFWLVPLTPLALATALMWKPDSMAEKSLFCLLLLVKEPW